MGLGEYMRMIRKHPHLPAEEQIDLVMLAKAGDIKARDKLVETSIGLAVRSARSYSFRPDFEDIAQEASLGLLKAIERFDIRRGAKFVTCAVWSIRGAIITYFKQNDPDYYNLQLRKEVYRFMEEFEDETGKEPSVAEIADMMNTSVERVDAILESKHLPHMQSLDALVYDDGATERYEHVPDNRPDPLKVVEQQELATNIREVFQELPSEERTIMQSMFLQQLNFKEIALQLGISTGRCREKSSMAIRKLRRMISYNSVFKDYLRDIRAGRA